MWFLFIALAAMASDIAGGVLCTKDSPCDSRGLITQRATGPAKSDSIKVNPAAVPVETVTGIETLYYRGFDVGLVKGLGRVGAAISPSNSDETFFGPPAAEDPAEFLKRMDDREKFSSPKYTLAGALLLYSQKGSGFKNVNLQLGAMARYEAFTHDVKPGVGLQAIWGPLYGGASYLQDEDRVNDSLVLSTDLGTWSVGISLDSLLIDYSVIQVSGNFAARASVLTTALFIDRFILTAAQRVTVSDQKAFYDYSAHDYAPVTSQTDYFGGVQFKATTFLIAGAFYNYYLLHEASAGVTFFF